MKEELLRLTSEFIQKFKDAYRMEDLSATDSYITNMVLPDYLSAALPLDPDSVFYTPLIGSGVVSQFVKAEYKKNIRNLAPVLENVFSNHLIWTDLDEDSYQIALKETLVHEYEDFDFDSDPTLWVRKKEIGSKQIFSLSNTRNNFKAQIEVYREKDGEIDEVVVVYGPCDRHAVKFRKEMDPMENLITYLEAELPFGMSENIRNTNSFWLAMQIIDQIINETKQ